jgi:YVTN family beta-propeller protein
MIHHTITYFIKPVQKSKKPKSTSDYVTNNNAASVSVIYTGTNTVSSTVAVGESPDQVAVSADGTNAYVTNYDSDTVSVIDTGTNTVSATISGFDGPFGVALGGCGTAELAASVIGDGRTVSIDGVGFPANAVATIALNSVTLGTATADGGGQLFGEFVVADCTVLGGTLSATAGDVAASTQITLAPCGSPTPDPDVVVPRFTG